MGNVPRNIAGVLLLASLVYAPWALGCVKPWGAEGLTIITLTAAGFCAVGCMLNWKTASPRWCLLCAGGLLLLGWGMVLNAHGQYDSGGDITPVDSWWTWAAGAVDGPVCGAMMWQITGVLAGLLVACELAASDAWRWRMIMTIAGTGVSISIYGLLQKAGIVPALAHRAFAESAFATYDYHGNAGAYLNLIIPAICVVAIRLRRRMGWVAALVCVAAVLANVSRAAMVISLLVIVALAAVTAAPSRRRVAGGIAAAVILATVAGGGTAFRRWTEFKSMDIRNNPRLLLLHLAVPMCGDAGWFGYGPGSFKLIYQNSPYIPRALFPRSEIEPYQVGEETSIYNYVHNDYLQFIIEWGWIGAAFWAALLGGGFVAGVKAYRGGIAEQRLILAAAMIGLGGVLVHAMIDWPLQVASLQLYAGVYLALLYSNPPCAYY